MGILVKSYGFLAKVDGNDRVQLEFWPLLPTVAMDGTQVRVKGSLQKVKSIQYEKWDWGGGFARMEVVCRGRRCGWLQAIIS